MRSLRLYPAAWRDRYGDELVSLVEELGRDARISWRDRVDIVRGGLSERARVLTAAGLPPREQARDGSLLVLSAWALFVFAGFGVAKASEHWQTATPAGDRHVPAVAFGVLYWAAGIGSALVLLGVALSLPGIAALIRRGGWRDVRRPIMRATLLSLIAAFATIGLARWAHSLTPAARNGHDAFYSAVFLAWVILGGCCLAAWTAAARATARELAWPTRILQLEVVLSVAVTVAMVVMTISTIVWWTALAHAAPWFFDGHAAGSDAQAFTLNIAGPTGVMLCAAALGLLGALRAAKAGAHRAHHLNP